MSREYDIKKDGTWDVFFGSESEALLDCDIKLGTGYGDEAKDFVKVKEVRRYELLFLAKELGRVETESWIEPMIDNGFIFYRKPDSESLTGMSLDIVTTFWVTAYDVPILRKRITGVDPLWNPMNDKKQIHYIYKYGERQVDKFWHF